MSMFIQNSLIRWILQPLANLANRIPEKLKNALFVLCGSGILFLNILNNTAAFNFRYLLVCVFDTLLIGIMVLCTMPQKIEPVKFDWKLSIPWLGFVTFMLIAGVTKSFDYLADTMILLVVFPLIFLIWASADFSRIVKLLTCTARVTAVAFFIVSFVFFPITGGKYASCFTNVNGFAFFLSVLFVLLLVGFLNAKKTSVWRWVDLLLMIICWGLTYYSNSRTGQLTCLATAVCTIILLLIQQKKWIQCLLWDILPILLVFAIGVSVVLPAYVGIRKAVIYCQEAIVEFFEREPSVPSTEPTTPSTEPTTPSTEPTTPSTKPTTPSTEPTTPNTEPTTPSTEPTTPSTEPTTPSTEPTTPSTEPTTPSTEPTTPSTEPTTPSTEPTTPSTEPTTPSTEPTTPSTKPTKPDVSLDDIKDKIDKVQGDKTDTTGKDINQFASGRLDIWKATLEHITFWGHGVDETFTFEFIYPGETREFRTAHMTILDFAYNFGILAGVFYLLFNLIAGAKSIVFALRQPKERWMLLPFAVTIAYACISLLATTSVVYAYMIALLYYLIQVPLFIKQKKD